MFKESMTFVVFLLALMLAVDNSQTAFALVLTEANNHLNHAKQTAAKEDDLMVGVMDETNSKTKRETFETQNDDESEDDSGDDSDDEDSDVDSDYSDSDEGDDSDDDEEFDIDKYKIYRGRSRRQLQSGPPGFAIDLVFASKKITKAQRQGFIAARNRWQSIITQDLASIACVTKNQKLCGKKFKKRTCIDDLMILVRINKMDGVGKILGSAGPCGMSMGQVRLGMMTFDKADANALIKRNLWVPTILHEMGHVLGIGTLWESYGIISPTNQGKPYRYLGPNGNSGLKQIQPVASNIIIEDEGGAGTARGHWKESVYTNELMTGYIEPNGNMPLSLFTIRSLQDLGYVVDVNQADPYALAGRRLRNNNDENRLVVGDDILKMDWVEMEDVQVKNGREKEFQELRKKHEKRRGNKN